MGEERGTSDPMGSAEMKRKPLSAVSSGFHPVGNGANRVSWGRNDGLLSLLEIFATSHFLLRWPLRNLHEIGTETETEYNLVTAQIMFSALVTL